jgi:hypothetical protein
VVIDATRDTEALVPEEFRAVQWTKLPAGDTTPAFCARVISLLGGSDAGPVVHRAPGQRQEPGRKSSRPWRIPAFALLRFCCWRSGSHGNNGR